MQGFQAPKLHKWLAKINKINEFQADAVAMCETKVNWDKKSLRKQFQSGLHNKSPLFGKLVNLNWIYLIQKTDCQEGLLSSRRANGLLESNHR
jgi:hypothetical protein